MKKIFFFALASLALASCSQDEEFVAEKSTNGSDRANGALTFSTYTAGATRATDVTSTDVKTNGFQVAAWYDNALYFNAGETAKVTAADGIADTEGDTYYWPSFSAGNIGFRAFNLSSGAAWTATKEYESIDFTVASTADTQKDLVIAYAEASSKPDKGVQPLNFTHALSKVNFSFKGTTAGNTYTINKIEVIADGTATGNVMTFNKTTEITGAKTDGAEADNTQAACAVWDKTGITGNLVAATSSDPANGVLYTYKTDDVVVNGTTANDLTDNFMLLPQKGKIAVRVYYKVEDAKKVIGNCGYELTDSKGRHENIDDNFDNTDDKAILGCKTVVINLGTDKDNSATPADIPAWEAGKAYRFTMTLPDDNFIGDKNGDGNADGKDKDTDADLDGDADDAASEFDMLTPIRFSVTVSNWVDVTANNITIK